VVNAVKWARQVGFENLNLDLIFGLPYQTLESWQHTLELALGLRPDHFSLYSLILEHGTPMNAWVERGLLPMPEDDLAASMYEWAMTRLPEAGYEQYEISNWARRDANGQVMACRHNLQYWLNLPYLGLGAGAHGYAGGMRTANVRAPRAYIERCLNKNSELREFPCTSATVNLTPIDRMTEMQETMMVGLRLVEEGVSGRAFEIRFGEKVESVFGREIKGLLGNGLLEWVDNHLRLTQRGRMVGNQVFMQFV
jgi:oxygen-independent coproporphyrinogen-3 oxidase